MNKLKTLIKFAAFGVAMAAIAQELRKPPEERQWHGKVAGFVPYDFRIPTVEQIQETYWNPENPRIFTDRVLGVGWGVNFGRLYKVIREAIPLVP